MGNQKDERGVCSDVGDNILVYICAWAWELWSSKKKVMIDWADKCVYRLTILDLKACTIDS